MYPEHRSTRSQDLSPGFYDVGQFYWGTTGAWQREEISKGLGLELPSWRVVDIDNEEDLVRAELYFKFLLMNKKKINL
jgi:CMP-N-acetylneuraminic acid synthetase